MLYEESLQHCPVDTPSLHINHTVLRQRSPDVIRVITPTLFHWHYISVAPSIPRCYTRNHSDTVPLALHISLTVVHQRSLMLYEESLRHCSIDTPYQSHSCTPTIPWCYTKNPSDTVPLALHISPTVVRQRFPDVIRRIPPTLFQWHSISVPQLYANDSLMLYEESLRHCSNDTPYQSHSCTPTIPGCYTKNPSDTVPMTLHISPTVVRQRFPDVIRRIPSTLFHWHLVSVTPSIPRCYTRNPSDTWAPLSCILNSCTLFMIFFWCPTSVTPRHSRLVDVIDVTWSMRE